MATGIYDYALYRVLDENGFEATRENLTALKQRLSHGQTVILDMEGKKLDESLKDEDIVPELLDESFPVSSTGMTLPVTEKTIESITEALNKSDGSVLIFTEGFTDAEYDALCEDLWNLPVHMREKLKLWDKTRKERLAQIKANSDNRLVLRPKKDLAADRKQTLKDLDDYAHAQRQQKLTRNGVAVTKNGNPTIDARLGDHAAVHEINKQTRNEVRLASDAAVDQYKPKVVDDAATAAAKKADEARRSNPPVIDARQADFDANAASKKKANINEQKHTEELPKNKPLDPGHEHHLPFDSDPVTGAELHAARNATGKLVS